MRSGLHFRDLNSLKSVSFTKHSTAPVPLHPDLRGGILSHQQPSGAGWFFMEHLGRAVLSTISLTARQESTLVLINSSCQEQLLICFYRTLMSLDYDSMEVGRFPALRRLEQP